MAKSFISAAERALIKGCAEQGVGIDDLGNGSTFRFVPTEHGGDPYKGRRDEGPSGRGTLPGTVQPWFRKLKLRNYTPPSLSLAPMYGQPMKGDDGDLTAARRRYADGDPAPLRKWLAEDCARRKLGL